MFTWLRPLCMCWTSRLPLRTLTLRKQKVDVAKEVPDQTADRLIGFLKIIKYRPNVQDP